MLSAGRSLNVKRNKLTSLGNARKTAQRIRKKKRLVRRADLHEELDGRLQRDQEPLRDDMKTYVKLHYELKEALMDFLVRWIK